MQPWRRDAVIGKMYYIGKTGIILYYVLYIYTHTYNIYMQTYIHIHTPGPSRSPTKLRQISFDLDVIEVRKREFPHHKFPDTQKLMVAAQKFCYCSELLRTKIQHGQGCASPNKYSSSLQTRAHLSLAQTAWQPIAAAVSSMWTQIKRKSRSVWTL